MPSTEVTLIANTVATVPLDAPTGRIVVTMVSGTASEVWATADGSNPVAPSSGVKVSDAQIALPAVLGVRDVLMPPLTPLSAPPAVGPPGRTIPSVRLLSAGTPVVRVAW